MTLRMRVLPRFPAKISSGAGIKISRPAGSADITVSIDVSNIIRVPSVPDGNKVFFLTWNSDLDTYSIMSFTDTFQAVIDTTGLMLQSVYDPTSIEADVFNRANHYGTNTPSDGTVSTPKIVDASVTTPKLADQSVTPAKLSSALSATIAGKMNGPASFTGPSLAGRLTGTGDVLALTRAESRQLIGGYEPIGDPVDLTGISQIDWANLAPFTEIYLVITARGGNPTASTGLYARVSTDNGATFLSGASDYSWTGFSQEGASSSGIAGAASGFIVLSREAAAVGSLFKASLSIGGFNRASQTIWAGENHYLKTAGSERWDKVYGYINPGTARNALRLFCSGGALQNGKAQLFGIRG